MLKGGFKFSLVAVAFIFGLQFLSSPAFAVPTKSAGMAFVKHLGDTALMSLTENTISRAERENRVRKILNDNFDVKTIGKFALGTYWRTATEEEKTSYMKLFEDMVVTTYTSRFEGYSGQTLEVGEAVATGKDLVVASKIVQKDGPAISIDWRLREKKEGGLRIIDVIVEGVSMSVTQRSDFSSVIQQGGGKISYLIDVLKKRNPSSKPKKG